jgi:hypothetical protein
VLGSHRSLRVACDYTQAVVACCGMEGQLSLERHAAANLQLLPQCACCVRFGAQVAVHAFQLPSV